MNSYRINEEHLGDTATEVEARELVSRLQAKGWDVEYGTPSGIHNEHNWDFAEEEDFNIDFQTEAEKMYTA